MRVGWDGAGKGESTCCCVRAIDCSLSDASSNTQLRFRLYIAITLFKHSISYKDTWAGRVRVRVRRRTKTIVRVVLCVREREGIYTA